MSYQYLKTLIVLVLFTNNVIADVIDYDYVGYISTSRTINLCNAVRIETHLVLTAAHCLIGLEANELLVIFPNNVTSVFNVESIQIHQDYSSSKMNNDIALVKIIVNHDNEWIKPTLAEQGQKFTDFVTLVSYQTSTTRFLSQQIRMSYRPSINLPMKALAACRSLFPSALIQTGMLCAGFEFQNDGICYGGPGSALVQIHNDKHMLIGLGSFGFDCGKSRYPSVFSEIAFYIDWIRKMANPEKKH